MICSTTTLALSFCALFASALTAPTVRLGNGFFRGIRSKRIEKFLGIPFAQPPTGDLRFRLPQPIEEYDGTYDANSFAPACPQQAIRLPIFPGLATEAVDYILNSFYATVFPDDEDCLYINVIKPASALPKSRLPVVLWIFGGGFEMGSPSSYDGGEIVERSIHLGEPVIYVSMNYRVSAWGFLGGQEVKDAGVGNLGLQDQREALRWVHKYIGAFGGDPAKVTIWGESAGAISVGLHMLTNDGDTEGLFRGGFMESGAPIPIGDITGGQKYFDALVSLTGCVGASDPLHCLRRVPSDLLKDAVNESPGIFSYQSLSLAWVPRVDGVFLRENPQQLVLQGKVASIPFVSGNCDDEGTLFALSTLNITTSSSLKRYLREVLLPGTPEADIDTLMHHYKADVTLGSPFDTGFLNVLTPQYKRIAAFLGDAVFHGPRRFFVQQLSGKQNIWAFLNKRYKSLPVLGSAHGSDILDAYGGGELEDTLINFVNHLDPNGNTVIHWPNYTVESPHLMTFFDGMLPMAVSHDSHRMDAIEFLTGLTLANPL